MLVLALEVEWVHMLNINFGHGWVEFKDFGGSSPDLETEMGFIVGLFLCIFKLFPQYKSFSHKL